MLEGKMKKSAFLIFLMLFAMFAAVSCSGENDSSSTEAGGSCSSEGAETCSGDTSQILVCSGSTWQTKKACNLNFGQYCRQTDNGSYSCTSSGNGGFSDTDDEGDSSDSDDSADTGSLPDTGDSEGDSGDNGDSEDNGDSADDGDSEDNGDSGDNGDTDTGNSNVDKDIETCAGIYECMSQCSNTTCSENCYDRGGTQAQNDYYNWRECKNSTDFNEMIDNESCKEAMIGCGIVGDMNYNVPYGKAVLKTSIPYIYSASEADSEGNLSIDDDKSTDTFITGTLGNSNSVDIVNPLQNTFAFAEYVEYTDEETNKLVKYIAINQSYQGSTLFSPEARLVITASEPGTYTVGVGQGDKARLFITEYEMVNSKKTFKCHHAIGFGSVTISDISFTPGASTVTIEESSLYLYSLKNAPMYQDRDISDDGDWKACDPQ